MAGYSRLLGAAVIALGCAYSTAVQAYATKHTDAGDVVRWTESSVRMYVTASLADEFGYEGARTAAMMASEAWRLPGVPDIEIGKGGAAAFDERIRNQGIHLVADWPHAPDQVAVTYVTYDYEGTIVGVDILLNGNVEFAILDDDDIGASGQDGRHDLVAVLTHEMGHVLGLEESPDDPMATMWPDIGSGETHQRTLTDDDEHDVIEIYAGRQRAAAPCSVSAPGAASGPPAVALSLGVLCLVCSVRRRRRRGERFDAPEEDR